MNKFFPCTSGNQLKITFLDVLDYSEYSEYSEYFETNISKKIFSRKHNILSEEAKLSSFAYSLRKLCFRVKKFRDISVRVVRIV